MWQTIVGAGLIGLIFVWIIVSQIRNKMKGKSSCSCGGNCGACGMNCHSASAKSSEK